MPISAGRKRKSGGVVTAAGSKRKSGRRGGSSILDAIPIIGNIASMFGAGSKKRAPRRMPMPYVGGAMLPNIAGAGPQNFAGLNPTGGRRRRY